MCRTLMYATPPKCVIVWIMGLRLLGNSLKDLGQTPNRTSTVTGSRPKGIPHNKICFLSQYKLVPLGLFLVFLGWSQVYGRVLYVSSFGDLCCLPVGILVLGLSAGDLWCDMSNFASRAPPLHLHHLPSSSSLEMKLHDPQNFMIVVIFIIYLVVKIIVIISSCRSFCKILHSGVLITILQVGF